MRTLILDDPIGAASAAAAIVSTALTERAAASEPAAGRAPVLALPTGRTMVPFYAELARRHAAGTIDLSPVRGFNLDELLLPPDHPATFHAYMKRHAWGRTGLDERRAEIPSLAAQPEPECSRYQLAIDEAGGFDLAILGVGADGHVAYNLPGPPVDDVHVVALPESLADYFQVPATRRPLRAITIGMRALVEARQILILATGRDKARAVQQLVDGPADEAWPVSLLRDHPNLDLILTRSAASEARNWRR